MWPGLGRGHVILPHEWAQSLPWVGPTGPQVSKTEMTGCTLLAQMSGSVFPRPIFRVSDVEIVSQARTEAPEAGAPACAWGNSENSNVICEAVDWDSHCYIHNTFVWRSDRSIYGWEDKVCLRQCLAAWIFQILPSKPSQKIGVSLLFLGP